MIKLTSEDWREIYYALDTKARLVMEGTYHPEDRPGEDAQWIAHIKRIMKEIGDDGTDAARDGVDRAW